ncbi:MAG: hypothetical protein HGA23_05735, partial [Bacteroidales bacterium]|nr:hypothetical protein [Bacteroidales bacterium]
LRGGPTPGGNSGKFNTALGDIALRSNTSGDSSTAAGYRALYSNTTGRKNTAFGQDALSSNLTGSNNTAIGSGANVASGALTNATAIGYNASVNASNKVVIGNASATTVGGYGAWTNYSDARLKENVFYKDDLGLEFIMKMKTASYNYTEDENNSRRDGLIAQDVQQVLDDMNLEFSGLVVDDDEMKTLNLSYSEFVIPLINAVKEQQAEIELLKKEIEELKSEGR